MRFGLCILALLSAVSAYGSHYYEPQGHGPSHQLPYEHGAHHQNSQEHVPHHQNFPQRHDPSSKLPYLDDGYDQHPQGHVPHQQHSPQGYNPSFQPPYQNGDYDQNPEGYLSQQKSPLITEYEWKYLDYLWKSPAQKEEFIKKGLYNYTSMIPIDVERSRDGRTFLTVIRSAGVPASMHTITDVQSGSGPLLKPYPDWSWYESYDCNNIISVFRVTIDECNRLWLLDTGVVDEKYVCPAKLVVFNLYTDKFLFKIEIPDDVAQNKEGKGLLTTPVVETYGPKCQDTTVYMTDPTGYGMAIYNGQRLYRLESPEFRSEPENGNFSIAGEGFSLADGVFTAALTPLSFNPHNRLLAFRPLASRSMYAGSAEVLKRSTDGNTIKYYSGIDVLTSQGTDMAFSSDGTLFYGLASEVGIGCWNAHNPMEAQYFGIALVDTERLQFASGVKVITNSFFPGNDEYVLLQTNRLQKVYEGSQNFNEINFRITRASVTDLVRGTVCEYKKY